MCIIYYTLAAHSEHLFPETKNTGVTTKRHTQPEGELHTVKTMEYCQTDFIVKLLKFEYLFLGNGSAPLFCHGKGCTALNT